MKQYKSHIENINIVNNESQIFLKLIDVTQE